MYWLSLSTNCISNMHIPTRHQPIICITNPSYCKLFLHIHNLTNNPPDKNEQATRERATYYKLFDEDVSSFMKTLPPLPAELQFLTQNLEQYCRQYIAKCVYNATYRRAINIQHTYSKRRSKLPVSFCWDLCSIELHNIKSMSVKRKVGGTILAVAPNQRGYL